MELKISLSALITIILFVASVAGTSAVTLYKMDRFEKRLAVVEGNTQLLLGLYIRNNAGSLPDKEWVLPSFQHP